MGQSLPQENHSARKYTCLYNTLQPSTTLMKMEKSSNFSVKTCIVTPTTSQIEKLVSQTGNALVRSTLNLQTGTTNPPQMDFLSFDWTIWTSMTFKVCTRSKSNI